MNNNAHNPTTTLWRSLKTLSITRVLIAGILLILLGLNNSKYIWSIDPNDYRSICFFYLAGALALVALQIRLKNYFLWQLSCQVTFDVVVISVLFYLGGGINSSLVILYLFPLASCAILAPLTWALLLSSLVAIYVLLVSSIQVYGLGVESAISNSGLYGATFLAMVYAVNRLANRLINQEELALLHEKNLRIQQEINNLVVADMDDGIIVVDRTSRVYACNPASKKMLGIKMIPGITKLNDLPGMHPIADAFFSWRSQASDLRPGWADTIAIAAVDLHGEASLSNPVLIKGVRRDFVTHLKLRFVIVNDEVGENDDRCVIFLQDASEIENQAQQLKLASMGRLTASIAHEVRNPLSSISYAAGLLDESDIPSEQASRLVKIVNDNVVRLNQLIEDILRLSRKAQINVEPFLLKPALQEIVQEFQEMHGLAVGVIQLSVPEALMIRFDPLHLREVVVNLLTNATRYASCNAGSIQLFVIADLEDHLELHVHDDGPGITAEVRAHLFEPFYTTSSRGTGLGLYMARELCLNNGALLDYEYRLVEIHSEINSEQDSNINTHHENAKANGRFVITFVKPK
jgi:two-component system sensor histidine kinase PilS (NtrC family)